MKTRTALFVHAPLWFASAILVSSCITHEAPTEGAPASVDAEISSQLNTTAARKTYIQQELQSFNAFITDTATRQAKYTEMATSSWAFYRATAHLYYKDLANGMIAIPSTWPSTTQIKTWLSGDLHLQNVGFFDNKTGSIKVDLNDFDESYVAPFYWDLIRLSAAIYLLRNDVTLGFNLTTTEGTTEVDYFLQKYQDTLTEVNGNSTEIAMELTKSQLDGFTLAKRDDLSASKSVSTLLAKWTKLNASLQRVFDFTNADLAVPTTTERSEVTANWATYKADISTFVASKPTSYFNIKDVAVRINSGLGSRGVKKYYVLIEGASASTADDAILEVKEQRSPSMLLNSSVSTAQYNAWFSNHAVKNKIANKALGYNVDDHLGVMPGTSRKFIVRQISPYKFNFDATDFKSQSDFHNFVKYCARAIGYGHARSDKDYNTTYVNYNAEAGILNAIALWPSAKTTIRNLALGYADQVQQDYQFFLQLKAAGQLP